MNGERSSVSMNEHNKLLQMQIGQPRGSTTLPCRTLGYPITSKIMLTCLCSTSIAPWWFTTLRLPKSGDCVC